MTRPTDADAVAPGTDRPATPERRTDPHKWPRPSLDELLSEATERLKARIERQTTGRSH
ncbi:MAG TPA: hypothetical protein VH583_02545 [Vicinamibacterales bacterium]|jgi:hypothetical protein